MSRSSTDSSIDRDIDLGTFQVRQHGSFLESSKTPSQPHGGKRGRQDGTAHAASGPACYQASKAARKAPRKKTVTFSDPPHTEIPPPPPADPEGALVTLYAGYTPHHQADGEETRVVNYMKHGTIHKTSAKGMKELSGISPSTSTSTNSFVGGILNEYIDDEIERANDDDEFLLMPINGCEWTKARIAVRPKVAAHYDTPSVAHVSSQMAMKNGCTLEQGFVMDQFPGTRRTNAVELKTPPGLNIEVKFNADEPPILRELDFHSTPMEARIVSSDKSSRVFDMSIADMTELNGLVSHVGLKFQYTVHSWKMSLTAAEGAKLVAKTL